MPRAPTYIAQIRAWEAELMGSGLSDWTTKRYPRAAERAWEDWGLKMGWPQDPKKVTASQVREYLSFLDRYASNTQYNRAWPFLHFLKWAGNKQLAKFKLKIKPVRYRVDWLEVEQLSAILTSCHNPQTRAIVVLMAYTGIRRSELCRLRMADVSETELVVRGKGAKFRRIPLTKQFWEALEPYMVWRRTVEGSFFLMHPKSGRWPIGPYRVEGIWRALKRQARALKMKFSCHTFRRSFGRHRYKMGQPLPEIMMLYGHSNPETTLQYIGINQADLDASMDKYQPKYL